MVWAGCPPAGADAAGPGAPGWSVEARREDGISAAEESMDAPRYALSLLAAGRDEVLEAALRQLRAEVAAQR